MMRRDMTFDEWQAAVTVGRIVRPQGHRGQVVVATETDFAAERFAPGAVVYVLRDGVVAALTVRDSRPQDDRWVVGFDAVATMNDAEALRGTELRIAALDAKALPADRFYLHDLIGCRVTTGAGEEVGVVERVDPGSSAPMLVVAGRSGEVLVPLAESICRRVDTASRVIVIDPPEGLLELNAAPRSTTSGAARRRERGARDR
jgi:16S rRNA processing protein RimM